MKVLVLSFVLILLQLGCSNQANNGFSNSNNSNNNNATVALGCNRFTGSVLSVRLNADLLNSNYVYVSILTNPPTLSSQSGTIKFLAGTESTLTNSSYAGFTVHYGNTQISGWNAPGQYVTQTFLNALNNNQVLPINVLNFHVQVGPNSTIIRIALEDSATSPVEVATMLIPSFDANPNTYAQNHSSTLLNLHPLLSYKSENWTSDQFRNQGEFICNQ